ncbi:MAG: flagellar hook-associated protein FlgL [Myxococcales bacterium]|nr:flagellar hook-associated protein FlgL [Myxococcales bacterium]
MRIPDSQFYASSQRSIARARQDMAAAQERAATGLRVSKPSDDPLAAAQARREASRGRKASDHARTIDFGRVGLRAADAALDEVSGTLQRARELALQAANSTVSSGDRGSIAGEIDSLRELVVSLANTEAAGRYVFGGYRDESEPFDQSGTYAGTLEGREVEVSPGVRMPLGVTGERIFGASSGQDVFAALQNLSDALRADDLDAIRSSVGELVAADEQVVEARGELGVHMNAFEMAHSLSQRTQQLTQENISELVGADPFQAYSDLASSQQALQAAVEIASQLPPPGLLGRG